MELLYQILVLMDRNSIDGIFTKDVIGQNDYRSNIISSGINSGGDKVGKGLRNWGYCTRTSWITPLKR